MFKQHRYPQAIILQAVYFKLRFTLSYRDVEKLLSFRGVKVDHSTIQRWVYKFTPMIEANMHKKNGKGVIVGEWMRLTSKLEVRIVTFIEMKIIMEKPYISC